MVSIGKLLNSVGTTAEGIVDGLNKANNFANNQLQPNSNPNTGAYLPSSQVVPTRSDGAYKRNIIHWFIPEIGVVEMYVNPQSINYQYRKLINKEKTKNGYSLQYFGEDLPTLAISGNTGSSGIEGMNVLYEIYRAEQIAFDPMAVQLYAATNDLSSEVGSFLGGGNAGAIGSGIADALFGQTGTTGLAGGINSNIPTLASIAFGIEMYYMGWVYRGYFENLSITESADNFLWNYNMNFAVTQRRGYRGNYFAHHRSANSGPSNNVDPADSYNGNQLGVPLSFKG